MSTYQLGPNVRWVVDRFTLKVTDGEGTVRTLHYPEAAIWDLLSRGYPYAKVVALTTHIAGIDATAAETLVRASLDAWSQCGLIETGTH